MPMSTISSKGQITLPAALRRKLGIKAHDRVSVEIERDGILIKPTIDFFSLRGFLGKGPSKSVAKARIKKYFADRLNGTDK